MDKYHTPIIDSILKEKGWERIEGNPVYIKETEEKPYSRKVLFVLDFDSWQRMYEDNLISYGVLNSAPNSSMPFFKEEIPQVMHQGGTVTYLKEDSNYFEYALIADFYSHNKDIENFEKYKAKYEELSGNKY